MKYSQDVNNGFTSDTKKYEKQVGHIVMFLIILTHLIFGHSTY